MGWNDWYAYYDHVTDKLLREAADVMVKKGMADVGYQYVDIDDCWANTAEQPRPEASRPVPRCQGQHFAQQVFPRHEGADRLHPFAWLEGRHLHVARPDDLCRLCGNLAA